MSRLEFRATVDAPRPASAWVMVTVASATLWITQQLDFWAIALQVCAILGSLWRRERPFAWQRNPWVLNAGMIGVVAGTVFVALRGDPSTIALAHFAALTQGIQLTDTRPRKTEFLLVTLALFQVVLASNLTDSVFFPPLLVAFVFATVWTLLVHTLRSEAIEAGDARAVGSAITPGLLRMTLFASSVSVVVALLLFLALPRLRSSVVTSANLAPTLARAGFSSRVALGDLGRIRRDPTVVMRIETVGGRAPNAGEGYWRGLAFDRFDGVSWWITPHGRSPVAGSPEGGVTFSRQPDAVNLRQRIVREPVEAGVVFAMGEVRQLQGTVRRLERDASGGLYAVGQADERIRYEIATERRAWRDADLSDDHVEPAPRARERNLQLPELSDAVAVLAQQIVSGASTDAERVRAIESHLLRNGSYTNEPPRIDPEADVSPVETFLFDGLAGHCEYFASAMVLLARSVGIPTRLVNGFAGGHENRIGDFLEITRSDAHSWVEVHYAEAGWVRYDPTPPLLRARAPVALSFSVRMHELTSALELWWFQRVIGFDRSDQIHAVKRAWLAWRDARQRDRSARTPSQSDSENADFGDLPWRQILAGVVAAALLAGLVRWLRQTVHSPEIPPAYAQALRLLARRGVERSPALSARDLTQRVEAELAAPIAVAFATMTRRHLAARFGAHPWPEAAADLRVLRRALRAAS